MCSYSLHSYYSGIYVCSLSAGVDTLDITTYLHGVNNDILKNLAIALGIGSHRLQYPQSPSFGNDIVGWWLQRVDQVDAMGGPTWTTLVKAMRHVTVGMNGKANDIEKKRLHGL